MPLGYHYRPSPPKIAPECQWYPAAPNNDVPRGTPYDFAELWQDTELVNFHYGENKTLCLPPEQHVAGQHRDGQPQTTTLEGSSKEVSRSSLNES